ncbi:MAG: hypothetical protein Q7N87_02120 [Candidatus Uhrbacteria bacterium]|nr:hypothetical protein [Candidatus Uhrbacteria bacterium]MDP3793165.1 hypothetical protein [Candidatus Uhrbacteria bacterium]
MIPLLWLIIVWIVLLAIFIIFSSLTILMNLKFGLADFSTYGSTILFLGVTLIVSFFTIHYFLTVDWSQSVQPLQGVLSLFNL